MLIFCRITEKCYQNTRKLGDNITQMMPMYFTTFDYVIISLK